MSLATDPFSLLCIGSFLFGILYICVTFLAGNMAGHAGIHLAHPTGHTSYIPSHGEFRHASHITTLAIFAFVFGLIGYIFRNELHFLERLAIVLAIVIGVLAAMFIIGVLDRMFGGREGTSVQDIGDLRGTIASVSIPIPDHGLGEIIYTSPAGMRKPIAARSINGQALTAGTEVIVQEETNGIAEVGTWEQVVETKGLPA